MDPEAHRGARLVLRLDVTDPECAAAPCEARVCCNGSNPFAGFDLLVRKPLNPEP